MCAVGKIDRTLGCCTERGDAESSARRASRCARPADERVPIRHGDVRGGWLEGAGAQPLAVRATEIRRNVRKAGQFKETLAVALKYRLF